MKLVIFDLDQTLVDFLPVHDEVARRLFKSWFGVEAKITEVDYAGKTLTDTFRELARLKNIPEDVFQEKGAQLLENYEIAFGESLPPDAAEHILPGVKELLRALAMTDNIVALYTGDSPAIVKHVFQATELGKYFKFCFYGTDVEKRADMVRLAIAKAERMAGRQFRDKDVVIIGDSIRDIECGKPFNALTIAVATGFYTKVQLSAVEPDYLFENLSNYRKVLAAIEAR